MGLEPEDRRQLLLVGDVEGGLAKLYSQVDQCFAVCRSKCDTNRTNMYQWPALASYYQFHSTHMLGAVMGLQEYLRWHVPQLGLAREI